MSDATVLEPKVSSPLHRVRPVGLRYAAIALGAILALMVLLILGAALLPSSFWRWIIVRETSHATGRTTSIEGPVTVHLLSRNPELIVEGFSLPNAPWASSKSMVTVKRFDFTLSLWALLRFQLVFPRVAIDSPKIDLQRDAAGQANWDFSASGTPVSKPANSTPPHLPVIQALSITDGALTANDRIRKLTFDGHISVEEKQNTADDHALKLRGTGKLNGKPFELTVNGAPLVGLQAAQPYDFEARVAAADIKLSARAHIAHPFDLGTLQARFQLSGTDLADVYYLTGLALPNTPPYAVAGTLVRDHLLYRIDDLQGKLGGSDIEGKIAIDTAQRRPKLSATLSSKQLNLADLAAPLGTEATPGKSNTLAPAAPSTPASPIPPDARAAMLLPDADLQVQRVRGMDADVTFDAASIVTTKMPMKKVHFRLILDDGKLRLDPLAFSLPQGEFSGTVSIDAQGATPETTIDMKLSGVDLAQFTPKSGKAAPLEGELLGRIQMHGVGSSVHKTAANADGDVTLVLPKGEMREAFAELLGIDLSRGLGLILTKNERNTEVRCGVANFKADKGDLRATTLLIDTTHVLVTGEGHIDLHTEALDLSLHGQPKQARMLRLRTPITLRGSLSQPKIGLDPGKFAAQAGGAAALGVLLTPLAAVLAFVDGGLAKDANCAALISQAEQGKNLPKE